jgi:hypothetical protein
MSRLISIPCSSGRAPPSVDAYFERVAKLVPVESLCALLAIRSCLGGRPVLEIAIYLALIAATIVYLYKAGGHVGQKSLQIAISCVSFVIWSYAIGGPFFWNAVTATTGTQLDYPWLAGGLCVFWSLTAGLLIPSPSDP